MRISFFSSDTILKNTEVNGEIPSTRNILGTVAKIAWPSTVESFFVALVALIDTIMVSGLGESAVAAVGLTTQPKFIGLAFFMSVCVSVSAIVARRRGEDNPTAANKTLYNALGINLIATAVVSVAFFFLSGPILKFVGSNADTHDDAEVYLKITMCAIIFQVVSLTINAAQRGSGNTKVVMRSNLVSNAVNLLFNFLLIHGNLGFPALGVAGAAIATVLGTIAAMIMSIISVLPGKGFVSIYSLKFFNFDRSILASIYKVGSSSLVEQGFLRFGFLLFSIFAASLGTIAFAAHQIGMNIMSLSFSFADGLSIAAVSLVGRSLGQGRPYLAKLYGAMCQRIGFVISLILAIIYFFFGTNIYGLFSDRSDVLEYGAVITNLISFIVFMQIAQLIYMSSLRGAGDTKFTAYASFISVGVIRPISTYILGFVVGWGLIGLWVGVLIDQTLRVVLSSARFKQGKWVNLKL